MLQWGAAERPQRILQPLGQCHKAFAAEHDMGVLPARKGQAEVIEPVIQRHTGDADAVIAHVGEIGKPQPARRMLLPEDDVLLGPVQRPPGTDALHPALAAATVGVSAWRKLIYSLIWQSVMWRPGKLRFLIGVKNPLSIDRPRPPENTAPYGPPPVSRFATLVGLRPPFVTHPATLSHPD